METRKIAVACAFGAFAFGLIAWLVTPTYWYLGILAGLAAGYFGYEFREVVHNFPIAVKRAEEKAASFTKVMRKIGSIIDNEPAPFRCLSSLTGAVLVLMFFSWQPMKTELFTGSLQGSVYVVLLFQAIWSFLLYLVYHFAAYEGARKEKVLWKNGAFNLCYRSDADLAEKLIQGYLLKEPTYTNVIRWTLLGLLTPVKWLLWTLPTELVKFIWYTGRNLVVLIHSQKRLLCAIDGTIGGVASFVCLAPSSHTIASRLVGVLFGVLIGAFLGVLNWELVSKRLLHLDQAPQNT